MLSKKAIFVKAEFLPIQGSMHEPKTKPVDSLP
jgi:hypothetical protein